MDESADDPTVAALFVRTNGPYFGVPNIDPWDDIRDARKYNGPHPVVAHPPCQRWGKMYAGSPLAIARTGVRHKLGDDGGCFKAAITAARTWGGVVEHPMRSKALGHFGIAVPPEYGGWVSTGDGHNGLVCTVEQGKYGHYARKPTHLIVYGVARDALPQLDWGLTKWTPPADKVDQYGRRECAKLGIEPTPGQIQKLGTAKVLRAGELAFRGGGINSPVRIDTPEPFKRLLIRIARKVTQQQRRGEA